MRSSLLWFWRHIWVLPVIVTGGLLLGGWVYEKLGVFVSTPTDTPAQADVIVALGGPTGARRLAEVCELVRAGYATRVFLAGPIDGRDAILKQCGVAAENIFLDGHSSSTWQEAWHAYDLMRARGWQSALVVSDPPHLGRVSWIWRHVLDDDMSFRLIPAPMPGWDERYWWRDPAARRFVESELIKSVYYLVRYSGSGHALMFYPRHHLHDAAPNEDNEDPGQG